MILDWKIRFLDRTDRRFKDRYLYLDTKTLDPVLRAAVELVADDNYSLRSQRDILKYRHLFVQDKQVNWPVRSQWLDEQRGFFLIDYFEDETGKELTLDDIARIMSENPNVRAIPRGARQHDLELMMAQPKPIPVDTVSFPSAGVRLLGYFVRDLEEMRNSAFMKDGPGSLTTSGAIPTITTAVTDDEIRSFVTIFRRLYMRDEPANFKKAVEVYVKALGDHPYARWVEGTAKAYESRLSSPTETLPSMPTVAFTTKRLIDVFLYTQYAHQPDAKREKQFQECLAEVQNKRAFLMWMFLTEIWKCSLEIFNAGNMISGWFKFYCDHHGISPEVLDSLSKHHSGLGAAEKKEERRNRLLSEKIKQLAEALWEQAGRPEGGPKLFLVSAREQLAQAM